MSGRANEGGVTAVGRLPRNPIRTCGLCNGKVGRGSEFCVQCAPRVAVLRRRTISELKELRERLLVELAFVDAAAGR